MFVLIAGPETLGEVMSTTALVRCLKRQRPEIILHYWVDPLFADGLRHNPYIDELHTSNPDPALLPLQQFDCVIDLRPSRMLRYWAKAIGARYLSSNPSFLVSFLAEHFNWYQAADRNLAEQYFEAVKPLGVFPDHKGLNYFLSIADEVLPNDIPMSHQAGYLALEVGEPGYDKPIPVHLALAFCRQVQYPVMLLNSTGNCPEAEALSREDPVKVYNACGKFTINETADLVRRSRLVMSGESGLMQVAVAFNRPLIVWRSSAEPTPFFPPYYPAGANNHAPSTTFAGLVWPTTTLAMLRKAQQQGQLTKKEQLWVQQGIKVVNEILSVPPTPGI